MISAQTELERKTYMKTSDFNYELPQELIAQDPLEDRSSSRLMVLDKETGKVEHHVFKEIIDYLNPGDCLVINDTKVIPARLIGAKEETGAKIEVLLLKRGADDVWETLVKPGRKAKPGTRISFGDGLLVGEVVDIGDLRGDPGPAGADAASALHYPSAERQRPVQYRLCGTFRIGGGADGRPAFHAGTAPGDRSEGCEYRPGDTPCGAWDIPPGEGG